MEIVDSTIKQKLEKKKTNLYWRWQKTRPGQAWEEFNGKFENKKWISKWRRKN